MAAQVLILLIFLFGWTWHNIQTFHANELSLFKANSNAVCSTMKITHKDSCE